jgi:hypothetical protein
MTEAQSVETVRREIDAERQQLVRAVADLRAEVDRARRRPFKVGLPVIAGAAVLGFLLAGGVRSTIRLLGVRHRRKLERESLGGALLRLLGR